MHAAAIVGRHCQQMRLIEWTELNYIGERKERESKKANNARLGPPIWTTGHSLIADHVMRSVSTLVLTQLTSDLDLLHAYWS